ncbi:MAG: hypothetical protein U0V70_01585 [Terriglobia bacterium]
MRYHPKKVRGSAPRPKARKWQIIGGGGLLLLWLAASGAAKDKGGEPYALLMGSCFDGSGHTLPGVKVRIEMEAGESKSGKKKIWQAISDARGEFAVRLPAGRHTFLVNGSREGFIDLQQKVSFVEDEREDVMLKFEPGTSKKP